MRYLFEIAYDGTDYHGWQRQPNAVSVQEVVEEALSRLRREPVSITGSGRTDTGVHCSQQYFHADFSRVVDTEQFKYRLNNYLPRDISIQSIVKVGDQVHARFDAIERAYAYHITKVKSPFDRGYSHYVTKSLDTKTMNKAATLLVGEHDFQAFSKVKTDVNNYICDIYDANWIETPVKLTFHIRANRFLRGMVRAIVGTLLQVGEGKVTIDNFKNIIESKDRRKAGFAAPAEGLFLISVKYPPGIF